MGLKIETMEDSQSLCLSSSPPHFSSLSPLCVQNGLARFGLWHKHLQSGIITMSRKRRREEKESRSAGAQAGKGELSGAVSFSVSRR